VLAFSILAAIAVATARETYDVPLDELDARRAPMAQQPAVAAQRRPSRAGLA
jgi:hypothetical protein